MTATAIGSYATLAGLEARIGNGQTFDASDEAQMSLICDQVNQLIEDMTGRVLAPIASATYLYDGNGTTSLYLANPVDHPPIGGLRAVTLVEVAFYTGAAYTTIPSTNYFLRQRVGMTGPFERLLFTDIPTSTYAFWPRGYATVRITGTAGWDAVPDTITEVALNIAQRAWNARSLGQQDVNGTDELGRPIVARYLAGRDKDILRQYTVVEKLL